MSTPIPDSQKLAAMKSHLDLIFIALASLSNLNSDTSLTETHNLEDLKALAQMIFDLTRQRQELVRRAVSLLENMDEQHQPFAQSTLLGDYLDKFARKYQQHPTTPELTDEQLEHLAIKLLIDLLFYSASNGYDRLWSVLLQQSC
ncbi:DUF3038 domain-containing protein [Gloeocapsa sp. PCC 73106]|uniref:DUF3038 domain-containing protein n=1 Tax=Gloeocapsa sp. PCC 73106 TaxID=102232 RepID=UPI0002ACBE5F|nr:DUF3038 domain-containing protein [Gloeocapsa sp. PCC 73106]ELR96241.1 Protein of unknown function (DUF3038) [Gloeocapsa sp. PCC 73106]